MKRYKKILPIIIGIIIGISTTVGAATIFNSKDITYSSSLTTKKNVKDVLDELYSKIGKCPEGKYCYDSPKTIAEKVKLGDYIKMTPTLTSYTIDKDLTGYIEDQTINPSELNLWRVISKQSDGSIIVLSEYISEKQINISGVLGFMRLENLTTSVGTAYTNEFFSANVGGAMGSYGENATCPTIEMCSGDNNYLNDYNIIKSISTIDLKGVRKSGGKDNYWTGSRTREGSGNTLDDLYIKVISKDNGNMFNTFLRRGGQEFTQQASFRPEIRLKANLSIKSGDGKSANTAYEFHECRFC